MLKLFSKKINIVIFYLFFHCYYWILRVLSWFRFHNFHTPANQLSSWDTCSSHQMQYNIEILPLVNLVQVHCICHGDTKDAILKNTRAQRVSPAVHVRWESRVTLVNEADAWLSVLESQKHFDPTLPVHNIQYKEGARCLSALLAAYLTPCSLRSPIITWTMYLYLPYSRSAWNAPQYIRLASSARHGAAYFWGSSESTRTAPWCTRCIFLPNMQPTLRYCI